ncbi:MAG: hypothetical protein QM765_32890 [Myxococcales bacterium]
MRRRLQLALPLALALFLSGLPALASAISEEEDACCENEQTTAAAGHSEGQDGRGCCNGSGVCSNCICCPVRSECPAPPVLSPPTSLSRRLSVTTAAPVTADPFSDIFQPPRA